MNTVARAWQAAMDALKEAHATLEAGNKVDAARANLRHALELIDVIDQEIAEGLVTDMDPDVVRMASAELRKRIEAAAASLPPLD